MILLLIPVHVALFRGVRRHYHHVAQQLSLNGWRRHAAITSLLSLSAAFTARSSRRFEYAKTLSPDVRAVYVSLDPHGRPNRSPPRGEFGAGCAPHCPATRPIAHSWSRFSNTSSKWSGDRRPPSSPVVLPEFVPARWWQHLFHNQRALLIKGALLFKPNVVLTKCAVPSFTVALSRSQ